MSFDLPAQAGPARDAAILAHIARGDFQVSWATVVSSAGGKMVRFSVMADALKIAGVRVNASAFLEQQIADTMGCSLLTPKLVDLTWQQRKTSLDPSPQPIDDSTAAMVAHSGRVDAAVAAAGGAKGIVATVGKDWVISNALAQHSGRAENYGWNFTGATFEDSAWGAAVTPGLRVIQDPGWAHNDQHVDYSQTIRLVRRTCFVGAVPMDLWKLLADPTLADAASHEGPLNVFRQPGVPQLPRKLFPRRHAATATGAAIGAAAAGPIGLAVGGAAGAALDWWRGRA